MNHNFLNKENCLTCAYFAFFDERFLE